MPGAQAEIVTAEDAEPDAMLVPQGTQPAGGLIAMIERVALSPDIDVDKLDRLLGMQERIMDREAEQAFNRAMVDARGEMRPVVRDANNQQTRSKYAKLESILEAIEPIYTRHGFMMSFGTDDSPMENYQRIVCDVSHADGHTRRYHDDVPIDAAGIKGNVNKTATHAHGSTLTYGRRNLTVLIWNLALKDQDDDGNAAGSLPITDEQVSALRAAIDEAGARKEKVCEHFGVKDLPELQAGQLPRVYQMLQAFTVQQRKKAEREAAEAEKPDAKEGDDVQDSLV